MKNINIEQELKKNVRWLARKTGKSNKQIMDDIKTLDKFIMGDDKRKKKIK
jgi:hypothetical protein